MSDEIREAFLMLIMGTNNTGKTTFATKLVSAAVSVNQPVLIVVKDTFEWPQADWVHPKFPHRIQNYVGIRKIIYFKGLLEIIDNYFFNGMLIFDDCKSYLKTQKDFNSLETFLQRRRQKSIDVLVIGHGFTQIPVNFFTYATHYVLFRTRENINRRRESLPEFDFWLEAQERVNSRAIDTTKAWIPNQPISKNKHYYEIIEV